jgi:hypothetical protein
MTMTARAERGFGVNPRHHPFSRSQSRSEVGNAFNTWLSARVSQASVIARP